MNQEDGAVGNNRQSDCCLRNRESNGKIQEDLVIKVFCVGIIKTKGGTV